MKVEQQLASYDFTGTGALSGDWTNRAAAGDLVRSNDEGVHDVPDASSRVAVYTGLGAIADDQFAAVDVSNLSSYANYGITAVRWNTSGTWYGYAWNVDGASGTPQHCVLVEYTDDVTDTLVDFSNAVANGNEIKLRVDGWELTMYEEGSLVQTYDDTSEIHASGYPGTGLFDEGHLDNFSMGSYLEQMIDSRRRSDLHLLRR